MVYPWWKGLLVIVFFPITVSYFIWKQDWSKSIRVGAIVVFWILFIGIGASSDDAQSVAEETPIEQVSEVTPEPEITLEKKQEDFKAFYAEYQKQGQAVLLVQASMSQLAQVSSSREQLYLALDKLSTMQSNLSGNNIDVPVSLKDNKNLTSAAFQVRLAASHFQKRLMIQTI